MQINAALNLVGKKVFTEGDSSNEKLSSSLDALSSELNLYKAEISNYNKKIEKMQVLIMKKLKL